MLDIKRIIELAGIEIAWCDLLINEAKIPRIVDLRHMQIEAAYNADHEHLQNQIPNLIGAESIVNYINNKIIYSLPHNHEDVRNNEYIHLEQIINWYVRGEFSLAEMNDVVKSIEHHHLSKHMAKPIHDYKHNGVEQLHVDSTIAKNIITLINTPNFKVYIPRTQKAAQIFSKYGSWCTSDMDRDKNMFDIPRYANCNLYYMKLGGSWFLLCTKTGEFMNSLNQPITKEQLHKLEQNPFYVKFIKRIMPNILFNVNLLNFFKENSSMPEIFNKPDTQVG